MPLKLWDFEAKVISNQKTTTNTRSLIFQLFLHNMSFSSSLFLSLFLPALCPEIRLSLLFHFKGKLGWSSEDTFPEIHTLSIANWEYPGLQWHCQGVICPSLVPLELIQVAHYIEFWVWLQSSLCGCVHWHHTDLQKSPGLWGACLLLLEVHYTELLCICPPLWSGLFILLDVERNVKTISI